MAKANPKTAAAVSVTALVPVVYDGTRYTAGDAFEIRGEDVEQLVAVNAVQVAAEAAAE